VRRSSSFNGRFFLETTNPTPLLHNNNKDYTGYNGGDSKLWIDGSGGSKDFSRWVKEHCQNRFRPCRGNERMSKRRVVVSGEGLMKSRIYLGNNGYIFALIWTCLPSSHSPVLRVQSTRWSSERYLPSLPPELCPHEGIGLDEQYALEATISPSLALHSTASGCAHRFLAGYVHVEV